MKQVVRFPGGSITVRTGFGVDDVAAYTISNQISMAYPADTPGMFAPFGDLCAHTESSQGLPFKPEHVRNMDPAQRKDAYELFMKGVSTPLRKKWERAVDLCNSASDIELAPAPLGDSASPEV